MLNDKLMPLIQGSEQSKVLVSHSTLMTQNCCKVREATIPMRGRDG